MSATDELITLKNSIAGNILVLRRLETHYREFLKTEMPAQKQRNRYHAVIVADFFERYYTCLETIFVRISQHFENSLDASRWHHNLLEKMKLRIDGIRESAVSEKTYPLLVEFLKFRHFKRYYFDIDYDWDKLEYLQRKFNELNALIKCDITQFLDFLDKLIKAQESVNNKAQSADDDKKE